MAKKQAIDVGHEMAALLREWRPKIKGEDVAEAIIHALERYSIDIEGPRELGLMSCLTKLQIKMEERLRSI
jgi:hypothetical protein